MKINYGLMAIVSAAVLMSGCSSAPTRIQAGGTQAVTTMGVDLADFRATAGELVKELLVHPAITRFEDQNGRMPVIAVGQVINRSDLQLDLEQITGRITEDLLNSGQIELMATHAGARNASARDAFEEDRKTSTDDRADFYLEGTILVKQANQGRVREKNYSFQMVLNDRNLRTRWQRTIDIAKQGTRGGVGW